MEQNEYKYQVNVGLAETFLSYFNLKGNKIKIVFISTDIAIIIK